MTKSLIYISISLFCPTVINAYLTNSRATRRVLRCADLNADGRVSAVGRASQPGGSGENGDPAAEV